METLKIIGIIIAVILIFNFVIFVHELGHFLAAKWRGMVADRFQIWFGKPIWKKKIGGVQYGLGWIPAGGFVSLPQMASMEGIEGEVDGETKKGLKPASPLDKIIVAFAGPLFSFGLALVFALVVWKVGKPANKVDTTTIGYVAENGKAAGKLQVGDKILEVEGNEVTHWAGGDALKSVHANIVLSEGDTIDFKVERDGKVIDVETGYDIPESSMWERKKHRDVGVDFKTALVVGKTLEHSPARLAGLQDGDILTKVNGKQIYSPVQLADALKKGEKFKLGYTRDGVEKEVDFTGVIPIGWKNHKAGIVWTRDPKKNPVYDMEPVYQGPWEQVAGHAETMWVTITKVASPKTDINPGHMQGFLGIGTSYFDMLRAEGGWKLVLWFSVLLNVNLAILNMLPLPVLDGGHITTSLIEMIFRKPIPAKFLAFLQTAFVMFLLGFMLFVTQKDTNVIYNRIMGKEPAEQSSQPKEMKFAPASNSSSQPATNESAK